MVAPGRCQNRAVTAPSSDADLGGLVLAGDADATLAACRALSDPAAIRDRAGLFDVCARVLRSDWWSGEEFGPEHATAAAIVATSVASLAELRSLRRLPVLEPTIAIELLMTRDRRFRDGWVKRAFDDIDAAAISVARRLIVDGAANKPTSDAYTIALIAAPGTFDPAGSGDPMAALFASVLDVLRLNPELQDDVWRIFEVEGAGENSLAAHDKYRARNTRSWSHALVALAADGTLDRDRLLDASLDAQQRGFAHFRAQWFSAFHEALNPTLDERASRSDRYLALSTGTVGPTVSMALKALATVQRAGRLDAANAVDGLGTALLTPAKGSALRALTLVTAAVHREPGLLSRATPHVVAALGHPALEVQRAAVTQLRAWHPTAPPDVMADVMMQRAGCHAAVIGELDDWLGAAPPDDGRGRRPSTRYVRDAPVPVDAVEWLASARRVTPVADADEFFELASATLEHPTSADDLERVVTFLAEHGPELATSPQATTLARRAAKLAGRWDRPVRGMLAELVGAAFGHPIDAAPVSARESDPSRRPVLGDLLAARVGSLARALASGRPFTPLASPTHVGGMIDPVVFAHRLRSSERMPAELVCAMLRLAPIPARLAEACALLTDPADQGIVDCLHEWSQRCIADSTAGIAWTTRTTTSHGYTHHELVIDGADAVAALAGWRVAEHHLIPSALSLAVPLAIDQAGIHWVDTIVPGLPEAWARSAVVRIGSTYGSADTTSGEPALLDRYFDAHVPMGSSVTFLLALTLNDARRPVASAAVDLALLAISDRRLDAAGLGVDIGELIGTGCVTPARWARTLREVSLGGSVHCDAVVQVLERAIARARPRKPGDLLGLLELLEALLIEDGRSLLAPDTRAALERCTGAGKTARAAARILVLDARASGSTA